MSKPYREYTKQDIWNLRQENKELELKKLLELHTKELCNSCGASSTMPMPCKVAEEKLEKIKEVINCDGYNKEYCIYCAEAHHCYTKQVLEIIESEN